MSRPTEETIRIVLRRAEEADRLEAERNEWIMLFNRLEAACRLHYDMKSAHGFTDEADDALYHAWKKVTRDAHGASV